MGGGGGKHLKNLYRWLHTTMLIEGLTLDPSEWRLYTNRRDTPRQTDHDCGLYDVMFGMCVSVLWEYPLLANDGYDGVTTLSL